jgi:predicted ATPase
MTDPADEEIMELMPQQMRDDLAAAARALASFDRAPAKAAGAMRIILNRHAVDHVRAALAKWGHQ